MDGGERSDSSPTRDPGHRPAFGASGTALESGPPIDRIESTFLVYGTDREGEDLLYYGEPLAKPAVVVRELWPAFRSEGYELRMAVRNGRYVLVAEPTSVGVDGIPWTNLFLFVATICSTLFVGAWWWYYIDPFANPGEVWRAWPFTAAILGVLGVHELGHYVLSRYHDVDASLPYFIPVPTLIGTMGAVIKMKGRMPNRKALFDIGVAGPLAGLVATGVVTVIGLHLPPVVAPESLVQDPNAVEYQLGFPPLLEAIAAVVDQPLYTDDPRRSVNPVVIGGWVGMLVTFLNLIPVGQLDGGHILRAMIGSVQETIGALVPGALFALAAYLYYVRGHGGNAVSIWVVWGLLTTIAASIGPAQPVDDRRLDPWRILLGVVTFGLGALCFMPVPIAIVG
ncbi:site-2 protease family protein [Natrialbaceae archaeon GCM10025810]|uniref:site-2 protease family protein n=1 Tax=Halovalidus salilacus TaxID=3075124 RepID=UPI00361C2BFE